MKWIKLLAALARDLFWALVTMIALWVVWVGIGVVLPVLGALVIISLWVWVRIVDTIKENNDADLDE